MSNAQNVSMVNGVISVSDIIDRFLDLKLAEKMATERRINDLAARLYEAKQVEKLAVEYRTQLESEFVQVVKLPDDFKGTRSFTADGMKVKVTTPERFAVDCDVLKVLAEENGLANLLNTLFRWKPELNKKAWDSTSDKVRMALSPAVTSKLGKTSVTFEPITANADAEQSNATREITSQIVAD